jgi:hypothetical protein
MRYQQFASHAHCGAAGLASKMALQQKKALFVICFEVSRSLITVESEFRARFKKTHHTRIISFLNSARNSRCTIITDTSKRSTQIAFSCCDAILETGSAALQ